MRLDTQIGLRAFRTLEKENRDYYRSYFFVMFSSYGLTSVLFNLYMLRLGLDPAKIGIVNGTAWVVFSLLALPAGLLGRRVPIGTIMRWGVLLDVGGSAAVLLAESLPRRLLVPCLLLGVILRGIGGTLYIVCSYPFLMTCKPENRDRVFSFRFGIEIVGAFIGNLIAGVLPATASRILDVGIETSTAYRASMLMVIPAMLGAYCFVRRIGQTRPRGPDPKPLEQTPTFRSPLLVIVLFALFTVLFTMGRQSVRTFYNVYLDRRFFLPPHVIGLVMGSARALGITVAALSAVLNRRYGPWRVYLVGQIAFVLTILALALTDTRFFAVAAYILFSAAVAITSPARDLYSQSVVAPRHRSLMSGAFNMAYGLGGSAIVYAGGFMISSLGFASLFSLAAAIMACGALLLAFALPRTDAQVDAA